MTTLGDRAIEAVRSVFGSDTTILNTTPVDRERGVFSHVVRAELGQEPGAVAVKLLRSDANGGAALTSGAVEREILAYEQLLPTTPDLSAPLLYGVATDDRSVPALVLQDLSSHRHTDQIDGLGDQDLRAVVAELITLHSSWKGRPDLAELDVRRSTPSLLGPEAIERGAACLETRWSNVSPERRNALQALAAVRDDAVAAFANEDQPTLCHGDPRGDNVAFDNDGRAVLFDWQQIAIQFGEADVSWLLATSVQTSERRAIEGDIVASYAMAMRQDAPTTWRRYLVGMVLPGLAVLLLAQRTISDERAERFVQTSIERIADAVIDLRVVDAVSS